MIPLRWRSRIAVPMPARRSPATAWASASARARDAPASLMARSMAAISAWIVSVLWRDSYSDRVTRMTSPLSPIDDQKKSIHPPLSASSCQASTAPVRGVPNTVSSSDIIR